MTLHRFLDRTPENIKILMYTFLQLIPCEMSHRLPEKKTHKTEQTGKPNISWYVS